MSNWSAAAFGNDDACDWAYNLDGHHTLFLLDETLSQAIRVSVAYLPYADGVQAMAAAEVVARLLNASDVVDVHTEFVDRWVKQIKIIPSAGLIKKARKFLTLVVKDTSELQQAWVKAGQLSLWKKEVAKLKTRLMEHK